MPKFNVDELESERTQPSRYPAERMPFSRTFRKRSQNAQHLQASERAKAERYGTRDDNYFNDLLSS